MDRPILVTGGLGFIGSAFIRRMASQGEAVVNVDALTYAASPDRLASVSGELLKNERCDVTSENLAGLIAEAKPTATFHFAAESHVTRSETQQDTFMTTNVEGTRRVIEASLEAGVDRVVHISTDEVYGPCLDGAFTEEDKEPGAGRATSPYARSKALADDVAQSYFGRGPVTIVRPTNCFGPWQHPEKAIARWVTRALSGTRLPVWGDGKQEREWMHVEDACAGIATIADSGETGQIYNLGPGASGITNLTIARTVARLASASEESVYLTAYDRPMHDRRYAVDSSKARALGWNPTKDLDAALVDTVDWYRANRTWWEGLLPQAEAIYADEEVAAP